MATLDNHREALPKGDAHKVLFDIFDTVANSAKTMLRFNAHYRTYTSGITDGGLNWLIRACQTGITEAVNKATPEQLRSAASGLREVADALERAVVHETTNQTE